MYSCKNRLWKDSCESSEYIFSSRNITSIVIIKSFRKSRNHGVGYGSRYIYLINCPNTTNNIFEKNFFDSFAVYDWECSNKVNHSFFRELIGTEFYIDISELLLIMMISENTIHDSTNILFIIIDTNFDFISSCENRINDKSFWELLFKIELENINSFLEFSTKISLKPDGRSWWLFFWFVVSESVFHHSREFF